MSRETKIAALVEQCLDHLATGSGEIPIADICAQAPELQEEVSHAVEVARSLPQVGAKAFRLDPHLGMLVADRYRLDSRLGAGAMGLVYEAADLDLSRRVALKLMRTDLAVHDTSIARFEREATTLAAVNHEAVVTVFDRGITADGTPYLAMELIDGVPCSRILEEAERRAELGLDGDDDSGWLTESFGIETTAEPSFLRQVLRWAAEIASGLAAAHKAGIVHRDLKPSNIIIRPDNRAVLIDFGIATAEDFRTLTGEDELVGTPAYMAPEALRGSQALGPQADVYGLAATLYHLLTLQAPFRGSVNQILNAIATQDPVPASRVRPGIPRGAQAILDHGMARKTGSRYLSLSAMESDIRALLAHRQVSVSPTSNFVRLMRRARQSKALLGAAAAALVIAGLLGLREWRAAAADARRVTFEEAWPIIPSNFGLVNPENRVITDPELHAGIELALDRLVASREQEPTGLVLRAAFRFDHGDSSGALADLERIDRQGPDPAVAAIRKNYELIIADPTATMDSESWPAASTPGGQYMLAFHLMRKREVARGNECLADPGLDAYRHAVEMRLFIRAAGVRDIHKKTKDFAEVNRLANPLVEDAELELSNSGYGGATIYHVIGLARLLQGRYGKSISACQQGLLKAPASFTMMQNAANAGIHIRETEFSMALVNAGLELAPNELGLTKIRAEIQTEDHDYDGARETLLQAPFDEIEGGQYKYLAQLVKVDVAAAYSQINGPEDALRTACDVAEQTAKLLPENKGIRNAAEILIAGIRARDRRVLFQEELKHLFSEPTSLHRLQFTLDNWPDVLSETDGVLVHRWVQKLGLSYENLSGVHMIR